MDKKNSSVDTKTQERSEFLDFLDEIIVDPLFFAFAVFMLFIRIQSVIEVAATIPTHSFWDALEVDIKMNLWAYILFLVIFVLWVALKGRKHRRELNEKKQLSNTLSDLRKAIEDLPDRIAEAIKSSNNEDNKPK